MIEIIEQFIMGKRPDQRLCEDGVYAGESFIAVVDGVTTAGKQRWDGLSSGGRAKEVILETLPTLPADIDAPELFDALDAALAREYENGVVNDDIEEYLRACAVVYSVRRREIWRLGDCQYMINGKLYAGGKKVDETLINLRSLVLQYSDKRGSKEDYNVLGRAAIQPFLHMQKFFENDPESDFGYGVLNGHGVSHSFIERTPVSAGDTVVLASDGYPFLRDTLAESEKLLADALEADPLCYRTIPGTKGVSPELCSFDDRSYIKFKVI